MKEIWRGFFLLDNAASAGIFARLDLQGDAGSLGEGLVDASVLHGGALCVCVSACGLSEQSDSVPRYRSALIFSAIFKPSS